MKKILVLLLLSCFISSRAQAQDDGFRLGLRAGVSSTNLETENLFSSENSNNFQLAIENANYGYHVGLFARMGRKLYLQPEILFNSNSIDYKYTDLSNGETVSSILKEKYQYVDIPLMVGAKLGFFRIQGGAVGHIFLNSDTELTAIQEFTQNFKDLTLGWQAGIGLDLGRFLIDLKYEGNFNHAGEHIVISGNQYQFSQMPTRMIASLGFAF